MFGGYSNMAGGNFQPKEFWFWPIVLFENTSCIVLHWMQQTMILTLQTVLLAAVLNAETLTGWSKGECLHFDGSICYFKLRRNKTIKQGPDVFADTYLS